MSARLPWHGQQRHDPRARAPRIEAAGARQLRRLNTNSRFHYAAIAAFAQRLADLVPDPLDSVFFVNSGSEAVDLALRLALAAAGELRVPLHRTFPLEQAPAAYDAFAAGGKLGKIVLTP